MGSEGGSDPASGSLRSALRHKGFGRFLAATVISSAGDFLNSVGLVVVIYRLTGSPGWLGAAAFLRVLAWAGATGAGGVIGDRFDRRQVLVCLNVVAGLVTLILAVSASLEASVVVIIVLSSLIDLASGLVNPSFAAAVPAVVGEDDVASANAAVTTVEQVSVVAGPALGAVLVKPLGAEGMAWAMLALELAMVLRTWQVARMLGMLDRTELRQAGRALIAELRSRRNSLNNSG